MAFGTYIKETWEFQQPNSKQLDLFIAQLTTDAVQASSNQFLSGAYVTPFYNYPQKQELKANNINTNCIITIAHDQDTQALFPDNSISLSKTVPEWIRPYVINARIENKTGSKDNAEEVYGIRDELIDLLCFNNGEYTNDGSSTETYKNRPLHNTLLEEAIVREGTTPNPSHYIVTLTILFKIYS